jgi:hypothetical protein
MQRVRSTLKLVALVRITVPPLIRDLPTSIALASRLQRIHAESLKTWLDRHELTKWGKNCPFVELFGDLRFATTSSTAATFPSYNSWFSAAASAVLSAETLGWRLPITPLPMPIASLVAAEVPATETRTRTTSVTTSLSIYNGILAHLFCHRLSPKLK